jgi:hypothetical protein
VPPSPPGAWSVEPPQAPHAPNATTKPSFAVIRMALVFIFGRAK